MAAMGGAGAGSYSETGQDADLDLLWKQKALPEQFDYETASENKKSGIQADYDTKQKFREKFYENLLKHSELVFLKKKLDTVTKHNRIYGDGKSRFLRLFKRELVGSEGEEYFRDLSQSIAWLKTLSEDNGTPLFTQEEIDTIRRVMKSLLESQEGGRRRRRGKRSTRCRRVVRRRRSSQRR